MEMIQYALAIPGWNNFFLLPVLGYIDPNTGGMLFQILAVIFAALSGFFLVFSGRIKSAFYQLKRRISKKNANGLSASSQVDKNPGSSKDDPNI